MAQFLNKGDHIFIPFGMFGMSLGHKGPYIYKSIQTAMANYGKDADEVVEYAPIVRCGKCRHFVPNKADEPEFCGGTCLYNDGCYVDTDDFCSSGGGKERWEMKVLVACEESQRVCIAFRERGHEAYSCDIQEPSGGHPEWHILGDVLPLINGRCNFCSMDGTKHEIAERWDILIAHPPCTDLAVSGARWFAEKRADGRQQKSIEFFMQFANCNCEKKAIENPICIMSSVWRKPDQIIQPYQFGHHARKSTCLWLKGLPKLIPTNLVEPGEILKGGYSVNANACYARDENGKILLWNDPRTAKARSKTFQGIADAMAEQWGDLK